MPVPGPIGDQRHAPGRLPRAVPVLLIRATAAHCFSGGLTVLFASRQLGLPAGVIGLAMGIGSTGALLGAILAPRIAARIGMGRSAILGAVLFPLPTALVAAASGTQWQRAAEMAAAEFVAGIGVMLFDVNLNALQTAVIPDQLRSQVTVAFSTINYGIRPVAAATGGILASTIGLRATLLVSAIGGLLSAVWLVRSPISHIGDLGDLSRR